MVIKITNFPRSVRPQWGLNAADHVYEYYLEDELTRFIGVFYGNDAERVGPIRSARPFDEQIVRLYKAIFAFGYADDRVIDLWTEGDLKPFLVIEHPDNCPPMCRIGPENAYNTLFTDTAQLSQYITDKGVSNDRQRLEGLRFEEKSLLAAGAGRPTGSRSALHRCPTAIGITIRRPNAICAGKTPTGLQPERRPTSRWWTAWTSSRWGPITW